MACLQTNALKVAKNISQALCQIPTRMNLSHCKLRMRNQNHAKHTNSSIVRLKLTQIKANQQLYQFHTELVPKSVKCSNTDQIKDQDKDQGKIQRDNQHFSQAYSPHSSLTCNLKDSRKISVVLLRKYMSSANSRESPQTQTGLQSTSLLKSKQKTGFHRHLSR